MLVWISGLACVIVDSDTEDGVCVCVLGTCVLAIASLRDVGDIPSKPDVSGEGTEGVIATWRSVSEYVQMLSERCLSRLSFLGWTAYRKLAVCFC